LKRSASAASATDRFNCTEIHKIEFSFLNGNLMVPAGHQTIFAASDAHRKAQINTKKRRVMTELFTMIVLAVNIIAASIFARLAATDTAAARPSDADAFKGRAVARLRARKSDRQ
jgi:hypothetical protein